MATGFSDAQLTAYRAVVARSFDLTGTQLQRITGKNVGGGPSVTFNSTNTQIPLHVRPNKRFPQESEQSGVMAAVRRFDVIAPWNTVVSVKNRWAVNDGETTTVSAGASSTVQTLASVAGIVKGAWLWFETALVCAQVVSVSGLTVTLASSVATVTNEAVQMTTLYEINGQDSGKSFTLKVICDCDLIDDGAV